MAAAMSLLLTALLMLCSSTAGAPLQARAIPSPPPNEDGFPRNSFQHFASIHLTSPPIAAIGFHIELGHNITVATSTEVQLGNYSAVKTGHFSTGPVSFEAYNGRFCPPVAGYYYLAAVLHLSVASQEAPGHGQQVTVCVCLAGRCHDAHTASLEAVTTTAGLQTITLSGLLSLGPSDAVVILVKTNDVTTATVWRHTSFMAFLWGRSQ